MINRDVMKIKNAVQVAASDLLVQTETLVKTDGTLILIILALVFLDHEKKNGNARENKSLIYV